MFYGILLLMLAVANGAETRDPALSPFDASSPWNMPLGDKAEYATINSPPFDPSKGCGINCEHWSHPVFIATPTDPEVAIFHKDPLVPFAVMRAPANAKPDPESDAHLHLIDETHSFVVEMCAAARRPDGNISARYVIKNDLRDAGVYAGWHGVRAYGGSAIAGLIRVGELTHGIRHVLAAATNPKAMNRFAPDGKAFVWPASSADSTGTEGNLYMGSLVAIPPTVDLNQLGLKPGPAMEIAIALQDYGAYLTDSASTNFCVCAEPAAAQEVARVDRADLNKLSALLKVVTNNAPNSIGGGGKPRRPLAPAFSSPAPGKSGK